MVAPRLLPFDAHNHIQLGPPPSYPFLLPPTEVLQQNGPPTLAASPAIIDHDNEEDITIADEQDRCTNENFLVRSLSEYIRQELRGKYLSGMALMATHPRDFATLLDLEQEIKRDNRGITDKIDRSCGDGKSNDEGLEAIASEETMTMKLVPCLGVHPWFLHELDPDGDWDAVPSPYSHAEALVTNGTAPEKVPRWIANLENLIADHPHLSVGEIGLDNFHFDPNTKEPTTPIDKQVEAFKLQLGIAIRWNRSVSLHCVRAMGKLIDALDEVAEENFQRLSAEWNESEINTGEDGCNDVSGRPRPYILPPRLYFHAFGGKAATATQLIKTLEKPRRIKILGATSKKKKFVSVVPPKIYFGFAPPVNFQSPKTASVIRAVGLERLVLETDREDIRKIGADMEAGTAWISEVLGITKEELVSATNNNARDLYGY